MDPRLDLNSDVTVIYSQQFTCLCLSGAAEVCYSESQMDMNTFSATEEAKEGMQH